MKTIEELRVIEEDLEQVLKISSSNSSEHKELVQALCEDLVCKWAIVEILGIDNNILYDRLNVKKYVGEKMMKITT